MKIAKKILVIFLKKLDLASALAVRLTKLTGKSKFPVHPKHLLDQKPWFCQFLDKNDIILDLGSGNGQNAVKAGKIAKQVIGLEINDYSLVLARQTAKLKKTKNVNFKKHDLNEKLKIPNATFTKVMILDVLEHLKKREQILAEIKRVLKPQGLLCVGVPNADTSWKKFQRSANVCSFADPDHKIEYSEESIRRFLAKHHFQIIHFGYGKFDFPARGPIDVLGAIFFPFYKLVTNWRHKLVQKYPQEAAGFEIVAQLK